MAKAIPAMAKGVLSDAETEIHTMSRHRASNAEYPAKIAWPAADVKVLFGAVGDTFASRLKMPIDPSKYAFGDRSKGDISAHVTTNFLPWALWLSGSDVETTRRKSDEYSGPAALKRHGAWVTLSSQKRPDEETLAFMRQFAADYGGFLTFDEQTWTTPAKPCPFAGLDGRKWEILRKIGFEHAPVIGAIMEDDDVLRRISELLQHEISVRNAIETAEMEWMLPDVQRVVLRKHFIVFDREALYRHALGIAERRDAEIAAEHDDGEDGSNVEDLQSQFAEDMADEIDPAINLLQSIEYEVGHDDVDTEIERGYAFYYASTDVDEDVEWMPDDISSPLMYHTGINVGEKLVRLNRDGRCRHGQQDHAELPRCRGGDRGPVLRDGPLLARILSNAARQ
jgi:hypothetical protein